VSTALPRPRAFGQRGQLRYLWDAWRDAGERVRFVVHHHDELELVQLLDVLPSGGYARVHCGPPN
jgi:hypothetical protein